MDKEAIAIKYRKIDASGDMVFGSSQDFYAGANAVAQAIYTRLLLLQGEWWEDQEDGLPLFQHIIGVSGSPEHIQGVDLLVQERILGTTGVTGITSFKSSFDSKARSYAITECKVQTQYGAVDLPKNVGTKHANGQYTLTLFPLIYQMN